MDELHQKRKNKIKITRGSVFIYKFGHMHKNKKIGIVIPDRGDRPQLLENCLRMMENQTVVPDEIALVNFKPANDLPDLTKRYRIGYDTLTFKGCDCILFIENDDYYHPNYIERMVDKWIELDEPELLGHQYTIYYHLKLRAWLKLEHFRRASAMNSLLKAGMNIKWCPDHEVYTDLHLWMKADLKGMTFQPLTHLCLGMKHGAGKCGGGFHRTLQGRFKNVDPDLNFLKQYCDHTSFEFYKNFSQYLIENENNIDTPITGAG